jgi:two-component system sensor histidine kinase BarA
MSLKASSKGVDLAAFVAPNVPRTVMGDPVRLNQVLSNLINNALKFTDTGYVAISVHQAQMTPGRDGIVMLETTVSDTGIGIPEDKLGSIFDTFTQADQTTTRRFGGTGLGLPICKRLVDAMGGNIAVESKPSRGSRFIVRFPARPVGNDHQGVPIATISEMPKAFAVAVHGSATPHAISRYLSSTGATCDLIADAADLGRNLDRYDAVFADAETVAMLNSAPARNGAARPKLVLVSEFGDVASDRLLTSGSADDVIMRPISHHDMQAMISLIASDALRGARALSINQPATSNLPDFGQARVLVVDDNAVNREVVLEVLRRLNVDVEIAVNGQGALEKFSPGEFALVFMDCSMPDMDGYEVTRRFRAAEQQAGQHETPVIALTAHVAGTIGEHWRESGMNAMITKPFTQETIADCLRTWIGQPAQLHEPIPATAARVPIANPAAPADSPIDPDVIGEIRELSSNGSGLLGRTIGLFDEHAPAALEKIELLSASDDRPALADAVHALKSLAANIGARDLARHCNQLENSVRRNEPYDLPASLKDIALSLHQARAELRTIAEEAAPRASA